VEKGCGTGHVRSVERSQLVGAAAHVVERAMLDDVVDVQRRGVDADEFRDPGDLAR
jgi:hypothetical protein